MQKDKQKSPQFCKTCFVTSVVYVQKNNKKVRSSNRKNQSQNPDAPK